MMTHLNQGSNSCKNYAVPCDWLNVDSEICELRCLMCNTPCCSQGCFTQLGSQPHLENTAYGSVDTFNELSDKWGYDRSYLFNVTRVSLPDVNFPFAHQPLLEVLEIALHPFAIFNVVSIQNSLVEVMIGAICGRQQRGRDGKFLQDCKADASKRHWYQDESSKNKAVNLSVRTSRGFLSPFR